MVTHVQAAVVYVIQNPCVHQLVQTAAVFIPQGVEPKLESELAALAKTTQAKVCAAPLLLLFIYVFCC
jgi:hypothetical protein